MRLFNSSSIDRLTYVQTAVMPKLLSLIDVGLIPTSLGFTSEEGNTLSGYCDACSGPAEVSTPLVRSQVQYM